MNIYKNEVLSEERQLMKWVAGGNFLGGGFQGEFDGWEFSGWEFSRGEEEVS